MSQTPFERLEAQLNASLQERAAQSLYRQRRITNGAQGLFVNVDGRDYLSFCGNDYLGLANHPDIVHRFQQAAGEFGVGSGASHLINGHSRAHHALEEELAQFTGRPRALLFSTGYMANIGILSALLRKNHAVLEDKLNHASLIDAGLFSGAATQRYLHADIASLEKLLQKHASQQPFIVTDGVFSMDGDLAPLPNIVKLAKQHNAIVMVDDAHGFGVLGKSGKGILEHFALGERDVPILMCTLGKALGTFGAFVAGSESLIETLIQFARTYIYTTALPPALAEATRESLRIVGSEPWRREKLLENVSYFKQCAEQNNLILVPSDSPIQPLVIGDSAKAVKLSRNLLDDGLLVIPIRPPSVPPGTARLRITLSTNHEHTHIDRLLESLSRHYVSL